MKTYHLTPKVLFILIWIFDVLGKYLGVQLFLENFETFYEYVISLKLCGKLIFKKRGLMVQELRKFLILGPK